MTYQELKIYEFDEGYRLHVARGWQAGYLGEHGWQLKDVVLARFLKDSAATETVGDRQWRSVLTPKILSVLLVAPTLLFLTVGVAMIARFERR